MVPWWNLRPGRLPASVREVLALERGERVLAAAPTRGGSYAVATSTALHLPVPRAEDGGLRFVRVPWQRIEHASWKEGRLRVQEVAGGARHLVALNEPGSVPETVRERVTSTVVADHRATLPGGGTVRITGRRGPGEQTVKWSLIFDAELDPNDPPLRAQAERLLQELRDRTGL